MNLKVFFPLDCLEISSGILTGHYCSTDRCYYVTDVISKQKDGVKSLGIWLTNSNQRSRSPLVKNLRKGMVIMKYNLLHFHVSVVPSTDNNSSTFEINSTQSSYIFLYNRKHILDGMNIFQSEQNINEEKDAKHSVVTSFGVTDHSSKLNSSNPTNEIADYETMRLLYETVHEHKTKKTEVYKPTSGVLNYLSLCYLSWFSGYKWNYLLKPVISGALFVLWMLEPLTSLLKKLLQLSSVGSQLVLKTELLLKLRKEKHNSILKNDIFLTLVFDTFIGLMFYLLITLSSSSIWNYSFDILMPSVDFIGKQVEQLIRWLMGIPIGLKLNSPLNQFLGKFFLHHVRLWLEYIQLILQTLNKNKAAWPLYLSCFGFSFFVAFLSDVVSLLTFHIYCFYVYAARLYGLQITGLMSLWRLFRGKKWNPLRNRVDTLSHSSEIGNHRFFTGTLLFTILLFLLPTTALYYAIFAVMRVATILLQNTLYALRESFATFPWFTLILRTAKPRFFAAQAKFNRSEFSCDDFSDLAGAFCFPRDVVAETIKDVTALKVHVDCKSYRNVLWESLKRLNSGLTEPFKFGPFFTSLVSGKLLKWS